MDTIRNFSIIAHIDHGKSTLADRLIERTGAVEARDRREQLLDTMDIERERGITIKSQTITLDYEAPDGRTYRLNLIDTPGHVDFTYEVSRALAACEGVLLLVDATQGVEAQTVAHLYSAMEHDLVIVPVINKIDMPSADIDRTREEIDLELGLDPDEAVCCSAKDGTGIDELLTAIVERIPPPKGNPEAPLQGLIFDASYDPFRGAVMACRLMEGSIRAGDTIRLMSTGATHRVEEVGRFRLVRQKMERLGAGEVGYVIAGIKSVAATRIGDTVTRTDRPAENALPGFREVKPVVFASIYPVESEDFQALNDALDRYTLNDASLFYEKDSSSALGQGFRCGFLGLLHLEIVQERLDREYEQDIVMTAPSVEYRVTLTDGTKRSVDNPSKYPDPQAIAKAEEPYIRAAIMIPERFVGVTMQLCMERRGVDSQLSYPAPGRVELRVDMPLGEVIYDFYDRLKSITQGYGSFDYEVIGYRETELVRLDILVNGEKVDALAVLLHRARARERAVGICERLAKEIPRHMFRVAIQGAIGGKVIARSTVAAFRKDVTAKCYGGDITRKRKLLEKQRKGKRKMKMVGAVTVPQQAFVAVLKTDTDSTK